MTGLTSIERPFDDNDYLSPDKNWERRVQRIRMLIQSDRYDLWVAAGLKCHNYWRVEVGQPCCLGCGDVKVKWSGIGCPCGHRWFCW